MSAAGPSLLSGQQANLQVSNEESSEASDLLPSLPSSSSSLFMATHRRGGPGQSGTPTRKRVTSLYGNPSIAASDNISIEGSSTYEYDVVSNLHKQQARRRRGDSNASISTVASVLSRNQSIADSYASTAGQMRDHEPVGYARGQFVSSGASSVRGAHLHNGNAAASLRRIRKSSIRGAGPSDEADTAPASGLADEPHLTDKLEQMIANSASYRAAQARSRKASDVGEREGSFAPRDRKSSYASLRSLLAFTPTSHRQSATGDYHAPSSRAASLFGVFGQAGYPGPERSMPSSSTWSRPARPSAPSLTAVGSETLSTPTSPTLSKGQSDAVGSLRGLRGLFDAPPGPSSGRSTARSRPALLTRSTLSSIPSSNPPAEQQTSDAKDAASPTTPSRSQTDPLEKNERKRHVSFQSSLRSASAIPPSTSTQRAFATIDPTSTLSAGTSGSATPRTVRSISPPISSKANSPVDLANLASNSDGHAEQSGSDASLSNSGAMPDLDKALARAEDRSGLKTSSRCTSCGKRAVNAPMTKSGDVFCSRECRIERKQQRRQASEAQQAAKASHGTGQARSDAITAAKEAEARSTPATPVAQPVQ